VRALLGIVLIAGGVLACALGVLIWVSIPRSDTATGSLIAFGAEFAVPGALAVLAGIFLLRRRAT
jgi:hypothetical protein